MHDEMAVPPDCQMHTRRGDKGGGEQSGALGYS